MRKQRHTIIHDHNEYSRRITIIDVTVNKGILIAAFTDKDRYDIERTQHKTKNIRFEGTVRNLSDGDIPYIYVRDRLNEKAINLKACQNTKIKSYLCCKHDGWLDHPIHHSASVALDCLQDYFKKYEHLFVAKVKIK